MTEYTEGDVVLDGIRIHYYRTGRKKPPFVMLHGAADNGLCWGPVAEYFSSDYDIILVDAQGHGKSDRLGPDFEYMDHARQVVRILTELGVRKPVIMGHSMGAGTAANIAVEYPAIPYAIILEDPAWMNPALAPLSDKPVRDGFAGMLSGFGHKTVAEIMEAGRQDYPSWSESDLLPWAESKLQFDRTLFLHLDMESSGYRQLVPRIDCPLLLVTSENGIVRPEVAGHARQLWQSDKPFTWVKIDGAGHSIRREQFRRFTRNVAGFLADLEQF